MNVRFLNSLYYHKTCRISGDELANLIEMKFGTLYKPEVVSRSNDRYFVVVREESDILQVNRVAIKLSEISHREFVKAMILKSEIMFDGDAALIEFRVCSDAN